MRSIVQTRWLRAALRSSAVFLSALVAMTTAPTFAHAANYVSDENDIWVYGKTVVERSSWCLTKQQRNRYRADAADGVTASDKYLILYAIDRRGEQDLVDADLEVRYVKDARCKKKTKGKKPFTAEYTFRPFIPGEKVPGRSYQLLEVLDLNNTQQGWIRERNFLKKIYLR